MLILSTYLKKETMKEVKQFFSSQIKSICLLFTIVVGGFLTLSSCSPACDEGNYLGTVEECEVTADTTSSGGGSGGSTGGSSSSSLNLTPRNRIASSYYFSQYILDNGSVVEWGVTNSGTVENYYAVDNLTNAIAVSGYGESISDGVHTCAIKADKTAVCWGDNGYGQLGDNTTTDCGTTASATSAATACATPIFDDPTAQGNLKFVEAGDQFTLWLDNNGKVYVHGRCDSGRLGLSCSSTDVLTATTVMTDVKDIQANAGIPLWCAHKNDNSLWCTGTNAGNIINDSSSSTISVPTQIATNVAHFGMSEISIGIVYDNNSVHCTSNFPDLGGWYYRCNNVVTTTNVKQVTGVYRTMTFVLDNGSAWTYGHANNGSFAAGNGNTNNFGWSTIDNTTTHRYSVNADGTLMTNLAYVTPGGSGSFGILDNGTLVGVGGNNKYERVPKNQMSNTQCAWDGTVGAVTKASQTCDRWMIMPIQKDGWQ